MPKPKMGQDRKAYMEICVPKLIKEGKSSDQSVAVCSSMWEAKAADMSMERRSFLGGLMALPVFGLFKKTPRDLSMWTDYPVKLTEPVRLDPFIEVNLDNGPVTIGGLTFSTSDLEPVRLSTGYGPVPKEAINLTPSKETVEKLRNLLKSNDGGTLDLIWGPDIFYNWVRIDYRESKHSNLIPLSRENHSRSEFFDSQNKEYGGLMKSFYHIRYKDTSNLWARIYGTPKELIPGKGFSHGT